MSSSLEKNLLIGFEILEGSIEPIDLISTKQQGSFLPAKYIGKEWVSLTITKFSDLFNREEINCELLDKSISSNFISLFVEIFNKGTLVI